MKGSDSLFAKRLRTVREYSYSSSMFKISPELLELWNKKWNGR